MNSKEAVSYIESFGWSKGQPDLDKTRKILAALGNPQNNLKFIHVAGSNGKGSSCAMFDAVLRAAGFHCGLYTSPYIEEFTERIQLGGEKISEGDLARITEKVKSAVEGLGVSPSQFELITAIAMLYYAEKKAEIVVLEVGLGGEFDATNVIDVPELACITNIGLEHTEYLGNSIAEIARAKGGIIKEGGDVVCYDGHADAVNVIKEICRERHANLTVVDFNNLQFISSSLEGQVFKWKGEEYELGLLGPHQLHNAALVLTGLELLAKKPRGQVPWSKLSKISKKNQGTCPQWFKQGLKAVRWPARLEVLGRDPLFILDGGHNPQCAEALAGAIKSLIPGGKSVVLTGVLADKDYQAIFEHLIPVALEFVCITPNSSRALPAEKLAQYLGERGAKAEAAGSYEEGIALARKKARDGAVIAFGSLYMAGEIRTIFRAKEGQKE